MSESTKESLPNRFHHQEAAPRLYKYWEEAGLFHAEPDPQRQPYAIVIPPPNVTGALHLGHALNNTLQDIMIRMKRMQTDEHGNKRYSVLWMPGTDHAGIATQAVVERRLKEEEGLTRHQLGREKLVARIWQWKEQYEARILGQLKRMGCSCDWQRTRFTLDEVCARAVRQTFFDLFSQGLIYRGKRLVNWDTFLQTAVSDDEVFHETVKGHFWHFRYPVIDPQPGEPTHVTIATTRPETMLGDTAVAVHPGPAAALAKVEAELQQKLDEAPAKERADIQKQLDNVRQRRTSMLPSLTQLRDMAKAGRKLMLPLANREIPLIADEWAKPELGSGCVKITPAHDANDYEVWQRNPSIGAINILNPDGTLNENAGSYQKLSVQAARKKVVADLDALGLLAEVEDREIDLAHSDRSKTPIEPYLAEQWFVKMDQLAQNAMDAVTDERVKIFPERYRKSYLDWLGEKRDWCISRSLWWGHRIQVWTGSTCLGAIASEELEQRLHDQQVLAKEQVKAYFRAAGVANSDYIIQFPTEWDIRICTRTDVADRALLALKAYQDSFVPEKVEPGRPLKRVLNEVPGFPNATSAARGVDHLYYLNQEEGVLDTWFSSQLWPHSTLGWPEQTPELKYWYPTSVLITSRDIITLWVARMVLSGLNNMGAVPFREVFIHPKILDGYGETMSKSKGNGVDPLDVIDKFGPDALRFGLAYLTTETQDVRMPVQFECPHCEALTDQTKQNRELPRIKCSKCGQDFSTQWARKEEDQALPRGAVVSERFEQSRNFCNKLWNASRFALLNLDGYTAAPVRDDQLGVEDRWLLSRLATVTQQVTESLERYHFADAARILYDFAWDEFCSFYVEIAKNRLQDAATRAVAQRVLAHALDTLLRLLHPMIPFITEEVWQLLNQFAPQRGIPTPTAPAQSIMTADWPQPDLARQNAAIEAQFATFQKVLGAVREIRSRQNIAGKTETPFTVRCDESVRAMLLPMQPYLETMSNARVAAWGPDVTPPPVNAHVNLQTIDVYIDLSGLIDVPAEIARNEKEAQKLQNLITGKEQKLSNASFVERAPPDVVAKEREGLAQLQEQLKSVQTALTELRSRTR